TNRADTNTFGTNYLVRTPGTGEAFVEFKPTITVPGDYDVYEWHPFRADASAGVPFIITHDGTTNVLYANQQTNAGNWNWLGRFDFLSGTNIVIRVTDAIPETNCVAIVDGLKLVFAPK